MNFLEEKIMADGVVKAGDILKVDNFLNHQIDINVIRQIAHELKRRLRVSALTRWSPSRPVASPSPPCWATSAACPRVFAKKGETANSTDDKYVSEAYSFTHKRMNQVFISRPYLHAGERILIVDDFLADGQAVHALIDIVHQAAAEVVGIGIAIEKGQQQGGRILRSEGYHLESIAIVESMDPETQAIRFRQQ